MKSPRSSKRMSSGRGRKRVGQRATSCASSNDDDVVAVFHRDGRVLTLIGEPSSR